MSSGETNNQAEAEVGSGPLQWRIIVKLWHHVHCLSVFFTIQLQSHITIDTCISANLEKQAGSYHKIILV